jgi:hypothetical protein
MKPHRDQTGIFVLIVGVLAILALGGTFSWAVSQQTTLLLTPSTAFPPTSELATGSITPSTSTDLPPPSETVTSSGTPDISVTQTLSVIATLAADKQTLVAILASQAPPATPPPGPTGIVEDNFVKFSGSKLGLDTQNGWSGIDNGNLVSVWVGSLIDDPQQGALHLMLTLPYRSNQEQFLTPEKVGALRIVAEQNNRLTLASANGATYYFDVPARRFVVSLSETVLTATPLPTYTPYAPPATAPIPTGYPYPVP